MQTIEATIQPNKDAISTIAYLLWEKAGCPHGRDVEFWMQAEVQLSAQPVAIAVNVPIASPPIRRRTGISSPLKTGKKSRRF